MQAEKNGNSVNNKNRYMPLCLLQRRCARNIGAPRLWVGPFRSRSN